MPETIVCDLHPGYASTRWARQRDLPQLAVQHHAAHASALAGEHADVADWLVFTWDGVGYGSDGTLWGGEALAGRPGAWERVASFRPFHLVGGDKAGREPWRSAAALLWETGGDPDQAGSVVLWEAACGRQGSPNPGSPAERPPTADQLRLARHAWERRINAFETSAVGRLFDAAAALLLGRHTGSFEGQGPMELEHLAANGCDHVSLPLVEDDRAVLRSDWAPLLEALTDARRDVAHRAGLFHESMAQALVDQALAVRERRRFDAVGLSGGVFQNRRLTERVVAKLEGHGIRARLHREIPANDGGLCFGQVIEAMATAGGLRK